MGTKDQDKRNEKGKRKMLEKRRDKIINLKRNNNTT